MSTIFGNIERKVYAKTFLQQVDVRLEYPAIKQDAITDGDVESFFKNHFDVGASSSVLLEDDVFLKDDQKQLAFLFSADAAMVCVGHLNYRSFYDSVLPNVYHIKDFVFNLLKQEGVVSYIRKVNVFTFENNADLSEDEFSAVLYDNVFSPDFLNVTPTRDVSEVNGKTTTVQLRVVENVFFMTYIIPRENGKYSLFLETILKAEADRLSLESELERMNNLLYNAFHWSVGKNIITVMNKEEEQ